MENDPHRATSTRSRRLRQFTLRGTLLMMVLWAMVMAWVRHLEVKYQAARRLEQMGAKLEIEPGPDWMSRVLGKQSAPYFQRVVVVDLGEAWRDLSKDVDDARLRDVGLLSDLRNLRAPFAYQITDEGLRHLRGLSRLEELNLASGPISDEGLAHLAGLRNLRVLDLDSTQITSAGLLSLRGMTRLEQLNLCETRIDDDACRHLQGMTRLRDLNLSGTLVGDQSVSYLSHLSELQQLWLSETRLTDGGLRHLKKLKQITVLSLAYTRVSDRGLQQLAVLPRLRDLYLFDTPVTDDGVRELEQSQAGLRVHR